MRRRANNLDDATFVRWARQLGFTESAVRRVRAAGSFEQAREMLEQLQTSAKKLYRKLAHEHHPDKGGDADDFRALCATYERLKDWKIRQRVAPSRCAPVVRVVYSQPMGVSFTWSGATNSTTGTW